MSYKPLADNDPYKTTAISTTAEGLFKSTESLRIRMIAVLLIFIVYLRSNKCHIFVLSTEI